MKIEKTLQPERVCGESGKGRDHLSQPFIGERAGKAFLVATDGRSMAVCPCEIAAGESGYVSPAALKMARKLGVKHSPAEITVNGAFVLADGSTLPHTADAKWKAPDWEIVPKKAPTFILALDPERLLELAKAIGSQNSVRLELHEASGVVDAMTVRSKSGAFGVMMTTVP